MAFAVKKDYSGLSTKYSGSLVIRNDNPNLSGEEYKPTGQYGDFIEHEQYGLDGSPTNDFAVVKDIDTAANSLEIGAITTVEVADYGIKKFELERVRISTAGGSEPTVSATSKLVEDDATDANSSKYKIPAFKLLKRHCAQDIFNAFEFSGDVDLVSADYDIGGTVDPTRVAGVTLASDIKEGQIVITANFLRTGADSATYSVAAKEGWKMQEVISPDNQETSKPTFSVIFTMILTKTEPSAAA